MGVHRRAESLADSGETVALVSVTAIEGSAPRNPGATMLVSSDGSIEGTIGGGNVEELARQAAVDAIDEATPRTEQFELRPEGNTGMVCDGKMEVFINVLEGRKSLVVAGGGHIAVPVTEIAETLGYQPIVVEDREEFADPDRFSPSTTVRHATIEDGLDETDLTENTAVVVATRSSALDRRAAVRGLESDAFYTGVVASEAKAETIREGLEIDENVDPDLVANLHAPVGLDLGADTPSEIAISILSEVELVRNGGTGKQLTTSTGR